MYPHVRSLNDEDQEEEERRILYVAMTRAKDELIITRTSGKYDYRSFPGGGDDNYFLHNLPNEFVDLEVEDFNVEGFDEYGIIKPWAREE